MLMLGPMIAFKHAMAAALAAADEVRTLDESRQREHHKLRVDQRRRQRSSTPEDTHLIAPPTRGRRELREQGGGPMTTT